MCHTANVKRLGRCNACYATRCLYCGGQLATFVRMLDTVKFRKKQWENTLYEHAVSIKTHTFESVCVNPACLKYTNPAKLAPDWQEVKRPVLKKKKSFDEAVAELEAQANP